MIQFSEFETESRELMIKFTCRRCRKEYIEPLKDCIDRSNEIYGHLHNLKRPDGWWQAPHGPLLCPECDKKYEQFMEGKDV